MITTDSNRKKAKTITTIGILATAMMIIAAVAPTTAISQQAFAAKQSMSS